MDQPQLPAVRASIFFWRAIAVKPRAARVLTSADNGALAATFHPSKLLLTATWPHAVIWRVGPAPGYMDALYRAWTHSTTIASFAVVVDAINNGAWHGFSLTPLASIPTPSTIRLLLAGIIGVTWRRHRVVSGKGGHT